MKNWPLRAKLTAWSALTAGVALLLCGIGAVLFIQEEQIETLDDQLANEAHTFFGEVSRSAGKLDWSQGESITAILPLTRTTRFIEVVSADGALLFRTKEPHHHAMPRLDAGMHTIKAGGNKARLGVFSEKGLTLYLAAALDEINADTAGIMVGFLIGLPLLVAVVAAGAWWVARKALAPVDAITVAAQQITAERLDSRLPVPRVNDEIGRLTDVLNAMFNRLDAGFRQAARFSADASHELKTPLTVLRTGIEALLDSPTLSSNDAATVAALLEQTHRLTSITAMLLLLSRADAGRLDLDFAPCDIADIITACTDDARIMAEGAGITIETDVPTTSPAMADERRLAQIILNLLDNAVKYNRPDGIVRIKAERSGTDIVVTVANTGAGISEKDVPKLFERFFRSDSYPDAPGHGLGLSLARELARAHRGDLKLVKSDTEWTTFDLRILAPITVTIPVPAVA